MKMFKSFPTFVFSIGIICLIIPALFGEKILKGKEAEDDFFNQDLKKDGEFSCSSPGFEKMISHVLNEKLKLRCNIDIVYGIYAGVGRANLTLLEFHTKKVHLDKFHLNGMKCRDKENFASYSGRLQPENADEPNWRFYILARHPDFNSSSGKFILEVQYAVYTSYKGFKE